uniref:Uncharacterized protein n=1 Tax=Arundo donax TaxID=35708 RepID=A0A0A9ALF4_ARUDO
MDPRLVDISWLLNGLVCGVIGSLLLIYVINIRNRSLISYPL